MFRWCFVGTRQSLRMVQLHHLVSKGWKSPAAKRSWSLWKKNPYVLYSCPAGPWGLLEPIPAFLGELWGRLAVHHGATQRWMHSLLRDNPEQPVNLWSMFYGLYDETKVPKENSEREEHAHCTQKGPSRDLNQHLQAGWQPLHNSFQVAAENDWNSLQN